ncbi:hypothetical protein GCM10009555_075250 [Acrocarpospora macrocephala]|uniref:TniQ domain-containing protein n=1 Tax=Acrocarpospora macrocephala TaxID=150177 RepID=A0A5M3X1D9_9ACTN|nr:TniQ family protein [Acrocarpospora macrocephala]GES14486.1 hypothetical protein Amac_080830 [Acrocarpospora macrocephala]
MDTLPLPRSLDPLPDESLRGYLLRLSYRLEIAPSQLAVLTGLVPPVKRLGLPAHIPHHIPSRRLASFDDASTLRAFAHSTRLTGQEAENLQMASFTALQPHRHADRRGTRSPDDRRPAFEIPWVFTAASRWCPQCLTGDGSPIQTELGGPWRKHWHLPTVFICPAHMTLLSDRCGSCLRTTNSQSPPCAIDRATDPGLHPLQCRATVGITLEKIPDALRPRKQACGAMLTDTTAYADTPLDASDLRRLLKLQTELLGYVQPEGPLAPQPTVLGRAVDPFQYFTDTALTASLVLLSWPATRRLCPSSTLAAAIDAKSSCACGIKTPPPPPSGKASAPPGPLHRPTLSPAPPCSASRASFSTSLHQKAHATRSTTSSPAPSTTSRRPRPSAPVPGDLPPSQKPSDAYLRATSTPRRLLNPPDRPHRH